MRKQKAIIFALLSVFSVSAVAVGAIAGSGKFQSYVHADPNTASCTLIFDANHPAKIGTDGNGTGASASGALTTVYSGAKTQEGKHVRLSNTGYMKNSGEAYQSTSGVGGLIHSIRSITVTYKTDGNKIDNPLYEYYPESESPTIPATKLRYKAGSDSSSLESGKKVTFKEDRYLPCDFKLSVDVDSDYASPENCYVDIESVIIECDHLTDRYSVSYDLLPSYTCDPDLTLYVSNPAHELVGSSATPSYLNFASGSIAAVVAKNADYPVNAETLEISNAAAIEYGTVEIYSKTYNAAFVTFGNSDVVVKANDYVVKDPYAGRAFVGKYTLLDPETYTNVAFELKQDATYTYGTKSGTYEANDQDVLTFSDKQITGFTIYEDGMVRLDNKPHSNTFYSYGFKGETLTYTQKYKASGTGLGYWGTLSNGSITHDVFTYSRFTSVIGETFKVELAAKEFTPMPIIVLTETHPLNVALTEFEVKKASLDVYETTDTTSRTATTYFKYNQSNVYTDTKINEYNNGYGTYTSTDGPDITLDGFGGYFMGQESGKFDKYDHMNYIVTINGQKYQLDKSNHTYKKIIVVTNFLATGGIHVYESGDQAYCFRFNGNKVTVLPEEKTGTYKFDDIKGTLEVEIKVKSTYMDETRNFYKFKIANGSKNVLLVAIEERTYEDYPDYGMMLESTKKILQESDPAIELTEVIISGD